MPSKIKIEINQAGYSSSRASIIYETLKIVPVQLCLSLSRTLSASEYLIITKMTDRPEHRSQFW